ncbi:hypothetical protein ACIP6J_03905, partial [Streptomyces sp. NPDC088760]
MTLPAESQEVAHGPLTPLGPQAEEPAGAVRGGHGPIRPLTIRGPARYSACGPPAGPGWVTVTLPAESQEVAHGPLTALGPQAEVPAGAVRGGHGPVHRLTIRGPRR